MITITSHTKGNDWNNQNWVTVANWNETTNKTEVHELPEFTKNTKEHFETSGWEIVEVSEIPNGRFNRKVRVVIKKELPKIHNCKSLQQARKLKKELENN